MDLADRQGRDLVDGVGIGSEFLFLRFDLLDEGGEVPGVVGTDWGEIVVLLIVKYKTLTILAVEDLVDG